MTTLSQLEPQNVWRHFENICKIPRPSYHEQGVIDYIREFADGLNLENEIDPAGNIIVRKPATEGMENAKGIIIQGHMDMVSQKTSESTHNFETDPIEAYIDGEWVTANGTTLGSDNGIGVAMALSVLESTQLKHPAIEGLFTVNEESGMSGALELQRGYLHGDWLLNIDTEEEGDLYVGCAGGQDVVIEYPIQTIERPSDCESFKLIVGGLKGGHSGVDIHTDRANANKISNDYLIEALALGGFYVSAFDGGSLRNAIPRDAQTVVCIEKDKVDDCNELAKNLTRNLRQIYQDTDPQLDIHLEKIADVKKVIEPQIIATFVDAIAQCPNGVDSWIKDLPDVVETSDNLAKITSNEKEIVIEISVRSSVESEKERLSEEIKSLFEKQNAKVTFGNGYPGWKPDMQSSLLQISKDIYQQSFGKEPGVKVIHAGLECGVIGAVYPEWEMISFGPTIVDAHSPDERCNISDVAKIWTYLKAILENVPPKN